MTSITNGTTVVSTGLNGFQQKYLIESIEYGNDVIIFRNIRRCINATGRLSSNEGTSPPSIPRNSPSTPTGVLASSSRPSQPPPTVVHHRGAYYTILRPTSRRTDVCYPSTRERRFRMCFIFL